MQEIWKDFPDERLIGAYQVSNHGNIRSLDHGQQNKPWDYMVQSKSWQFGPAIWKNDS